MIVEVMYWVAGGERLEGLAGGEMTVGVIERVTRSEARGADQTVDGCRYSYVRNRKLQERKFIRRQFNYLFSYFLTRVTAAFTAAPVSGVHIVKSSKVFYVVFDVDER